MNSTLMAGTLPLDGAGYFNSDNRGTGTLENAGVWFDWLAGILDTLYLDATCGAYACMLVLFIH